MLSFLLWKILGGVFKSCQNFDNTLLKCFFQRCVQRCVQITPEHTSALGESISTYTLYSTVLVRYMIEAPPRSQPPRINMNGSCTCSFPPSFPELDVRKREEEQHFVVSPLAWCLSAAFPLLKFPSPPQFSPSSARGNRSVCVRERERESSSVWM